MIGDSSETGDPSARGVVQTEPRPGMVELGPGYLDPGLVPAACIQRWAAEAVTRWGARSLAYGANPGPAELRALLAARVPSAGTARCGPGNVLITGGTSAALDMLAIRFAREGRVVLTEDPTYDLGRLIFTGRGVTTVPVPGPADDLDIGLLRRAARDAARAAGVPPAIYLIPTFHNPTGRVLGTERRQEVLALARDTGAVVVEDQAYAEVCYEGAPPPPLWALRQGQETVITLYSFAKCLAPGLRLGWLVGPERLVAELASEPVRVSGGGPNHFTAMLVLAGVLAGELDRHITSLCSQLRARRDALLVALGAGLPEDFILRRPAGGFFTWLTLPPGLGDQELLDAAEQHGVSFAAGSRFGTSARAARLCFAAASPERLALGAARFLAACPPGPGGR
jgi:2-aminoadipate transaminase